VELTHQSELLEVLHEKTLSEGMDENKHNVQDMHKRYKIIMGDIKKATTHLVEKLVDKGFTSGGIIELVPDIGGLYPQKKLLELEESIRKHNDEQEALLGLQKLRHLPRRATDPNLNFNNFNAVRGPKAPMIEEENPFSDAPNFFQRIFIE